MKKKLIIAGVVVIVGVSAYLAARYQNDQSGDTLFVSGTVEVTETDIGFKMPGRIAALDADEGQRVKSGEPVASLDSAELESIVKQNRAAVNSAAAELEKYKTDYERASRLVEEGAISAQQMDAARTALHVAEARLRQYRAALAASQDRLRDTVLCAPISGVILRKNVELGETVPAGAAVFTIGDLENPWIKVYINETELGLVKLGQKAEVSVDSFPDKVYAGTVTFISSKAEFTPKDVQTQEERVKLVFGVKVSVTNQNDELKPGMPADVKILLREKERAEGVRSAK